MNRNKSFLASKRVDKALDDVDRDMAVEEGSIEPLRDAFCPGDGRGWAC